MDKNTFFKVVQVVAMVAFTLALPLWGQDDLSADPPKFDSLTVNGKTYTKAIITLEKRTVAVIKHDGGVSRVKTIAKGILLATFVGTDQILAINPHSPALRTAL